MARPKSALRQKLEEIALAHSNAAAAAAAAAAASSSASASSPAYTEHSVDTTTTSTTTTTTGATPYSDTTGATPSSSTSTWPAEDSESRSRIATELERLSLLGPEQINKRNWDYSSSAWQEMLAYVSPTYAAYWDNFPRALTFWENVEGSRAMAEGDPGYAMEVEQIGSDVDEVGGKASVFMQLRVLQGGVTFQGMSTLTWERTEGSGRWMCTRHDGYRAGNAGFD